MDYIAILLGITVVWIVGKLSSFAVMGWFISKEDAERFMDLPEDKIWLNSFDTNILSTSPYITKTLTSVLCKYYIEGVGSVPRWSKLHKRIEYYYRIAQVR
jgi:hypothetical protein